MTLILEQLEQSLEKQTKPIKKTPKTQFHPSGTSSWQEFTCVLPIMGTQGSNLDFGFEKGI